MNLLQVKLHIRLHKSCWGSKIWLQQILRHRTGLVRQKVQHKLQPHLLYPGHCRRHYQRPFRLSKHGSMFTSNGPLCHMLSVFISVHLRSFGYCLSLPTSHYVGLSSILKLSMWDRNSGNGPGFSENI